MTPDKARDKIDMIYSERPVHERVAGVLDSAVGMIMARFSYTRAEALAAMHSYSSGPAGRPRRVRRQREHEALA
jgi:hypothetical protein